MKKFVGFILGVLIVLGTVSAYADGLTGYFCDGKWYPYNEEPVHVVVNGKEIQSDMPPILLEGSTLIPVRSVFEEMGADISWDGDKQQAGVSFGGINLILNVNDNKATVNGSVYEMKIPPKVINDRTMIPLRFVAEALGMKVGWNEKERIASIDRGDVYINSIETVTEGERLRVVVSSDMPISEQTSFEMQDNLRVVVDIKNAVLKYKGGDLTVNNGYVNKIRVGQTSTNPNVTRIVADINTWTGYTVSTSPDKKQLYIDFDCRPAELQSVEFSKVESTETIKVGMKYDRNILMYSVGDGKKVYIDVPMASLQGKEGKIQGSGALVKSVETQQLNANTVRLLVETTGPCVAEVVKNSAGTNVVFTPLWSKKLQYSFDGGKPRITLKSEYTWINYYNYSYRESEGRFILTLPKNSLNSGLAKAFINDGYINDVSIVPNSGAGTVDLVFESKVPLAYSVDSVSEKDCLSVTAMSSSGLPPVSRGPDEKMKQKVIVIDPGHGGSDPGAVFKTADGGQITEKDLNLKISMKLYELLKKAGMKVYMTRTDDRDVGLYERADFANNLNAALFVSVHNNAGSSWQRGTMTLFYPSVYDKSYGITGERFAQIAQEELLRELGTNDMGVWKRPKLAVLNTTKMPAILAEVSYLTNDSDRANLLDDAFREKAAKALFYSIIRALGEIDAAEKVQRPDKGTSQPPVQKWKPEDYIKRNIYGFAVPALAESKCDYSWKDDLTPSWYDLSIKLDYKKEVDKKYTLEEQRKEAEQVLKSVLDAATVSEVMKAVAYQKDYNSYIWEDEIEAPGYNIWVRCLKNTGICTIDVMKK